MSTQNAKRYNFSPFAFFHFDFFIVFLYSLRVLNVLKFEARVEGTKKQAPIHWFTLTKDRGRQSRSQEFNPDLPHEW